MSTEPLGRCDRDVWQYGMRRQYTLPQYHEGACDWRDSPQPSVISAETSTYTIASAHVQAAANEVRELSAEQLSMRKHLLWVHRTDYHYEEFQRHLQEISDANSHAARQEAERQLLAMCDEAFEAREALNQLVNAAQAMEDNSSGGWTERADVDAAIAKARAILALKAEDGTQP